MSLVEADDESLADEGEVIKMGDIKKSRSLRRRSDFSCNSIGPIHDKVDFWVGLFYNDFHHYGKDSISWAELVCFQRVTIHKESFVNAISCHLPPFLYPIMPKTTFCFLIFLVVLCHVSPVLPEEPQGVPPLKVVYFTPSDRIPPPGRQERLGRVMRHIQEFYRKGMEANEHGPKTFALEWETPEKLRLYDVKGQSGYPVYSSSF